MNTKLVLVFSLFCMTLIGAWKFGAVSNNEPAVAGPRAADIERGEYLVAIMACNDCHTPFIMGDNGPEPDMSRMLSGHPEIETLSPAPAMGEGPWIWAGSATNTAFAGPWGISYAANLTPDMTGLSGWTEEMFVSAIKTGWHLGVENSRMIQPPMPWPAYRYATTEDLKAIYAYLKTIPPVRNIVPAYQPLRVNEQG